MKKDIVPAARNLLILFVFTISIHAQWEKTNWPAANNFFDLSTSQNHVFARTWDSLSGGRMFFTANNGINWTQISSSDSSIGILSVAMTNNEILAGTWNGFYRSSTDGASWNETSPTGIPEDAAIWSLTMVGNTYFAGAMGDIFKSADNGSTWTEVKSGIPANARIRSIIANENSIFAVSDTSGIFISTNNATSWSTINSGLTDKHIFNFAAMGSRLFAITPIGVFSSINNGTSWAANISNLKKINCFLAVDKSLFAGTDSSGCYISSDSGATWTSLSTGMPANNRIWSLVASNGKLFAGTSTGIWSMPFLSSQVKIPATSSSEAPISFRIQNRSKATIGFTLNRPVIATVEMFDLCSNRILSHVQNKTSAGIQHFSFETGSIASGLYIVKLTVGKTVYQRTVSFQR